MGKLLTQERFTALASTGVAIAILGAAVTAQPSRSTTGDRLEQLESDLRYQLELDARVNPSAYASRTKALEDVLGAWRKSNQAAADRQMLQTWLRKALAQSLPGESGEWPAAPVFSATAQPTTTASESVAVTKPVVAAPKAVSGATEAKKEGGEIRPTNAKPHELKKPAGPETATAEQKPSAATVHDNVEPAKPFIVHVSDPVPFGSEALTTENSAAPGNSVLAKPEVPEAAAPADAAKAPAPSAAQTAAVYNESADDPPSAKAQASEPPVEVNLAELNARIGGYHDGLREVESAVVAGRDEMSTAQLSKLVKRLESLAAQYQFVRLYYSSLTAGEREFVVEPRSMADTIELVDRQRSRVEARSEEDHFSTADGAEETELSRRLEKLLEVANE